MVSEVEQQYQDCIDSVNQAPARDAMSLDDKAACFLITNPEDCLEASCECSCGTVVCT